MSEAKREVHRTKAAELLGGLAGWTATDKTSLVLGLPEGDDCFDEDLETLTVSLAAAEQAGREAAGQAWVPVAERLPAPGVDVLVLDGSRGTCHVLHLLPDPSRGWCPGGWGIGFTSHWMPLPEPPSKPEGPNRG